MSAFNFDYGSPAEGKKIALTLECDRRKAHTSAIKRDLVLCDDAADHPPTLGCALMDRITEAVLTEFTKAHQVEALPENQRF